MTSDKGIVNTKTWTPAVPAKRPDNIVSSDYARTTKVFTPSYERECRPCMNQLIANEYQRMWWEERKAWAKNHPDKTSAKKFRPKHDGHSRKGLTTKSSKDTANKSKERSKQAVAPNGREKKSNPQHDTNKS